MAQHFIKATLSASINGRPIKINATATAGTTIHTATSSATLDSIDEVYLWAGNSSTSAANLTIQLGTFISQSGSCIYYRVPALFTGPIPVLPGVPLHSSEVITATASVADVISVWGFVNRIGGQTTS